ncbi:hypothetical protein K8I28_09210 [bacterium]|nr:hypothetical protein [bacterium]
MKVHRGLIWVECDPRLEEELMARRSTAKLIVAHPAKGWLAIKPDSARLFTRLLKQIGQTPKEEYPR